MSENLPNDTNSKKRKSEDNSIINNNILSKNNDIENPKILRFSKGTIRRDCIGPDCKIQVKINFTLCGGCFNKRIRNHCKKCKKELLNDDGDENNNTSYEKHLKTCLL
jgi:hypothetical protein